MKAIILAAGRGSRMQGLTDVKPKCLTMLDGKTLLEWQLASLRQAGVEDIVVVGGYRKECLEGGNYTLIENPRWAETNMVMTMTYAEQYLSSEECIISYADIIYHPDIVKKLIQADGDIVMTYDRLWQDLWKERFDNPLDDAETFRVNGNGVVQEIGQKASSLEDIEGQYMGLLKIMPHGWESIEELMSKLSQEQKDKLDMTALLQHLIQSRKTIKTVACDGKWGEVDSEEDAKVYEANINNNQNWTHDWRW